MRIMQKGRRAMSEEKATLNDVLAELQENGYDLWEVQDYVDFLLNGESDIRDALEYLSDLVNEYDVTEEAASMLMVSRWNKEWEDEDSDE